VNAARRVARKERIKSMGSVGYWTDFGHAGQQGELLF
jgi:hypothetical protein